MEANDKETGQINYEPNISDKATNAAEKAQRGCVTIWVYGFYGAILATGIFLLTQGGLLGWALIGVAIVLFLLYWLFGFVLFIK